MEAERDVLLSLKAVSTGYDTIYMNNDGGVLNAVGKAKSAAACLSALHGAFGDFMLS